MTYASTCPAAITGLLAALGRSQGLAGVLVTRGGGITDPDADEVVSVGYGGVPDEAAAEGTLAQEGGAGDRDREQYAIRCAAAVVSGDAGEQAIAAATERAFALFAACGEAIVADGRLGGAVMNAYISSWSHDAGQVSGGVSAVIRFSVSCDAYTRR